MLLSQRTFSESFILPCCTSISMSLHCTSLPGCTMLSMLVTLLHDSSEMWMRPCIMTSTLTSPTRSSAYEHTGRGHADVQHAGVQTAQC